ncbi:MtrAB system accessory lipoprotein LpqB [Williamsia maris]|uniref:Lipoprotein LpqB n=1 Tax=Williamsia maris TaxID=72806 RepID=A0ABT1HH15_9NOCA|nr:MtrAB system accessory lipoprotein LpqB [Williamsia maris]MCP2177531.1 Sporulation and spore germination [Williamsia maris]
MSEHRGGPRPSVTARRGRWTVLILLCVVVTGLSGCVSIPTSSSPQPIGSLERRAPAVNVPTPRPGMDPESLVRDFLKATANPSSGHLAARQYLTSSASDAWDDRGGALILSQINVLTDARTDSTFTARIIGDNAGTLQSNGHLVPATGRVESRLSMVLVDGQWRIDGALPSGVMIDRTQFTSSYRPRDLFYPSASGEYLVADPRWLYSTGEDFSDQLVDLLVAGPSDELARAVVTEFPAGAALRGSIETTSTGGVRIELTGLSSLAERNRTLLAAQLIWTLNKSDVPGPFVIDADGAPLNDRYSSGWRTTDVASLDPTDAAQSTLGLHVIRAGALDRVDGGRLIPIAGPLGTSNALLSATISTDGGRVAAVTRNTAPPPAAAQALQVGDYGGVATTMATGTVISRPSFGPDRDTIWAVVDGRVLRWSRDATGTVQAPVVVDSDAMSTVARGVITELRVSRDGARVAAIVGGKTVLAVVSTATDGAVSLTGARDAAFNIAGQAVSLDWISGDTVVVARNTTDTPVVQVSIDGTPAVGLLSGNLTPPVTAVVGDNSTLYAADSRGILQLGSTNGEPDQYWNEVAPTMGSQSIPVLPQ